MGGDIGAPSDQASILSRNGIDEVEARSIYANINAKSSLTPLDNATGGRIGILRTLDPTGTFQGTIRATHIDGGGDRYIFAGDVEGLIHIGSDLNTGNGLLKNNRIVIDGSLGAAAEIRLPPSGLKGFIIMDNLDSGSTWSGDVVVLGATPPANIVLGPDYPNLSAALGGGSAGTVPFELHGTDSIPADGASVAYASRPDAANPIRIREYGPIVFTSGQIPVTITAESNYPCTLPVCPDFTSCIIPASASIVRDVQDWKTLVITPPAATDFEFLSGYTYTIRPVRTGTATLKCDIASPVPVADWEYSFCVGTADAADINGDGSINISDFNILTSHFAHAGCPIGGDVNADGNVNIGDFNIVAGKFGTTDIEGCNAASAMRSAGGENQEFAQFTAAVQKLGFESLADFSAWLEELAPADQLDALVELLSHLSE